MTGALGEIFEAAGAEGFVHAVDLDGGAEVAWNADAPVVMASVFKIPIVLEYARQAAAGAVDRTERVVVTAADRMGDGDGIGTDACLDDVELSLRDAARLMMTLSDNAATDVVLRRVGRDNVNATLAGLGLAVTRVGGGCKELFDVVWAELGIDPAGDLEAQLGRVTEERIRAMSSLDPSVAPDRSTPREMTRLLGAIWRDEAGPAEACAEVRRIMGGQIWPHRLSSGFPDEVRVSGKTGTMWGVRNEAGVVEYPDGGRYAVAVFQRTDSIGLRLPRADAAIGHAARAVVEELRR